MQIFKKKDPSNKKGTWSEGAGGFLLAIGFAFFIRWGIVEAYVIPSGSMLPTILIHDHIFVNKFIYGLRVPFTKQWMVHFHKPEKGEVLIFRYPKDESIDYIKRIVGVPGDVVEYKDGELYLNDKKVDVRAPNDQESNRMKLAEQNLIERAPLESYIHGIELLNNHPHSELLMKGFAHNTLERTVIPEGNYLVFGDNRDDSEDSRVWGFVPEENIIGRAMFVWLSCENTLPVLTFICNPLEIRWNRFFHPIN